MAFFKTVTKAVWLLVLLAGATVVNAQKPDTTRFNDGVQTQLEEAGYRDDESADPADLIEELEYLSRHRINVNSATLDELSAIPVLSRDQAIRLSAYVATFGSMLSPWELMAVDGFDSLTIARVEPYLDFSAAAAKTGFFKRLLARPSNRVLFRIQHPLTEQAGYAPLSDSAANRYAGTYQGTADRILMKYSFETKGGVRAGITAEKDPGEEFFQGSQRGFDFYSAHVFAKNLGAVKQLALGDFHANFGQGLTLWTGFGFGKPSDPMLLNRNGQGLRPSTGTDENRFLRGGGIAVALGNLRITAWGSSLAIDGTADESDTTDTRFTPSESPTGLHRTPRELASKDAVTLDAFGGRISWQKGILQAGVTGYSTRYSSPIPSGDALYQKYYFSGDQSLNLGLDYQITLRRLSLFGEAGINKDGKAGVVTGLRWDPDIRTTLALLYRNYDKAFSSPLGSAFGENSRNANEQGLYAAFSFIPLHKLTLTAWSDFFRFPWLRYRVDRPSTGEEFGVRGEYELTRETRLQLRYRFEHKELNATAEAGEYSHLVGDRYRHSLRGTVKVDVTGGLRLTTLAEWSRVDFMETTADGYLLAQQVRAAWGRWSLSGAFMLFSANNWDTRIYVYEPDVLYAFTAPAVYGEGTRLVMVAKYEPSRWVALWLRYAVSRFDKSPTSITSADDYLDDAREEIKLQVIVKIR